MDAQRRGLLLTVAGPSGVGKSTLLHRLLDEEDGVRFSVSMTTRLPRPGEREGVDYLFVSVDAFRCAIDEGRLLEWAEVHGRFYGTPAQPVDAQLAAGFDVVLDIDVQGARQVRARRPDGIFIFVCPPSLAALEARLRHRGTEDPATLAVRLQNARWELGHLALFDYLIVNDDLQRAYPSLRAIVLAERCRRRPELEADVRRRLQD